LDFGFDNRWQWPDCGRFTSKKIWHCFNGLTNASNEWFWDRPTSSNVLNSKIPIIALTADVFPADVSVSSRNEWLYQNQLTKNYC
jgi:hypothetical protein